MRDYPAHAPLASAERPNKKREMPSVCETAQWTARAESPGTPKACRLRRVSGPATREAEPNGAGQPESGLLGTAPASA